MARQVAHEIKNPLTPMKLNIQYLQQALKNNQVNIKELVDRVAASLVEQIDNLSYIASEFSNFAKMPEARPEKLELSELLERSVELYVNAPDISVGINSLDEKLFVYADRSQLLRVFNNLLENAKQAIPEDRLGQIEVFIRKEGDHAEVSVSDNGTGMTEEVVKKIFHPYFTTKTSGTGLGLAMTKKIIEFWKGEIWFDTKDGEGSVFYIRLPLMKD
jgi:nitrogen fixation/metabolism regulation signal transduction histidine kinase